MLLSGLTSEEKKLSKKILALKRLEALRPPYTWNFFLEESSPYNDPHRIRYSTNPNLLYKDGRVENFMSKLNLLYVQLKETDKSRWDKLILECITILDNKDQ